MTCRKGDEWQDHRREPGEDEELLLEAVGVSRNQPRYMRVLGSVLTNEEWGAFERAERVDRKDPSGRTDRGRTYEGE